MQAALARAGAAARRHPPLPARHRRGLRLPQAAARDARARRSSASAIDPARSWIVGDSLSDLEAGRALGIPGILVAPRGTAPPAGARRAGSLLAAARPSRTGAGGEARRTAAMAGSPGRGSGSSPSRSRARSPRSSGRWSRTASCGWRPRRGRARRARRRARAAARWRERLRRRPRAACAGGARRRRGGRRGDRGGRAAAELPGRASGCSPSRRPISRALAAAVRRRRHRPGRLVRRGAGAGAPRACSSRASAPARSPRPSSPRSRARRRSPWNGQPLARVLRRRPRDPGGRASTGGCGRFLVAPRRGGPRVPARCGEERREVLLVGLANGPVLATLLKHAGARITILEEDAALARGAGGAVAGAGEGPRGREGRGRRRRRALGARAAAREVRPHRARRELVRRRLPLARALSHRRDHRWTVAGLRAPTSPASSRGAGCSRSARASAGSAATLREAAGLPARGVRAAGRRARARRAHRLGAAGTARPASTPGEAQGALRRHRGRTGIPLPLQPRATRGAATSTRRSIRGERPRGLAFSTPLDLSPTIDERPFFDSVERLTLSPRGRTLPEELEPLESPARLRILPTADRALWGILLAGLAAVAAALALRARAARRGAAQGAAAVSIPAAALWHGAAARRAPRGVCRLGRRGWRPRRRRRRRRGRPCSPGSAPAGPPPRGRARASRPGRRPRRWRCSSARRGTGSLPAAVRLGPAAASAALIAAAALLGVAARPRAAARRRAGRDRRSPARAPRAAAPSSPPRRWPPSPRASPPRTSATRCSGSSAPLALLAPSLPRFAPARRLQQGGPRGDLNAAAALGYHAPHADG